MSRYDKTQAQIFGAIVIDCIEKVNKMAATKDLYIDLLQKEFDIRGVDLDAKQFVENFSE